jgi:formyltetrahydrofolate-dependent phosphoribosylglycinamide formyltransferase
MKRRRVGILISGRGSNMEALIRATRADDYPAQIAVVISNRPDALGLAAATALGANTFCIDHETFTSKDAFEAVLENRLVSSGVELIACAGFMRIFSAGFVDRWQGRIINIHPSLLPSYPGLDTHARVIADGVRIHGCTVHFMTAAVDAGPIIAQSALPVLPEETAEALAQRVLRLEHELYPLVLRWLAAGDVALKDGRVVYRFAIGNAARLLSPLRLAD